jgi:hypothetical protein
MRRCLSVFGTCTVDEASKTVTCSIVPASFPNWEGEAQTRAIDKLTSDEFVNQWERRRREAGGRDAARFDIWAQVRADCRKRYLNS